MEFPEAILFDLDGVLLDTEPFLTRAWSETAKKYNHYLSKEKITALIDEKISSKGECDKEGFESHACSLNRSQEAFKTYYQTECTWNKYGTIYAYCEVMLKKDRLKWLDKTLGS